MSFVQTKGVVRGDDLVLNGQKMWITNGMQADWMSVMVNTEVGVSSHSNKSIVCLPLDAKGVTRTKLHKMGMHASDTAHIFLDDVHVPLKYVIGERGKGFHYQIITFQAERLGAPLSILKVLDNIIDMTIDYTKSRSAFGQPILNFQSVHFKLAELATEIEALRALTYFGIESAIAGRDVSMIASMVKLKGGRLYRTVADNCLQYWGATGYAADSLISRLYRDGRLLSIGGGADEVMLRVIAKDMRQKK